MLLIFFFIFLHIFNRVVWSLRFDGVTEGEHWIEGRVEILAKDEPSHQYRVKL
jgi:hypothetical protein